MPPSKLSYSERMRRKREAARLRQQRCRARKRNAVKKKKQATIDATTTTELRNNEDELCTSPELSALRASPDHSEILTKQESSFMGTKTTYPLQQDLSHLRSCASRGNFIEPTPNTPVFTAKPIANKPGSFKSAFFSPHSITRHSSPSSLVQRTPQHKQGSLFPRPHWKPVSTEFLPPCGPFPTEFHSSCPNHPLSPRFENAHAFDENEMTAVDAMLSLRYSPVSVTSSPARIGRSIKNAPNHVDKPFIPVFNPAENERIGKRQQRHYIAEHVDLRPGLHMYYN